MIRIKRYIAVYILLTVHIIVTQYGETALHIACKKGSDKVEKVLITEGADQTIMNKVTCIIFLFKFPDKL